jgi:hypothetical protein
MNTPKIAKRNQPLPPQPPDTIESLKETIQQLRHQVQSLEITNKNLLKSCNQLKHKSHAYDKVLHTNQKYTKVFQCCISLLRLLHSFSPTASVVGSFLRKCFEFLFLFPHIKDNDWIASLEQTPISIIFAMNPSDLEKSTVLLKFLEFSNYLHSCRGIDTIENFVVCDVFSNKLEAVDFQTNKVQTLTLVLGTLGQKLTFHIYAWTPLHLMDFSVNVLRLSMEGISSMVTAQDFLQTLENILHHQATFLRKPDQLQLAAFPPHDVLPYETKSIYLSQIADLLSIPYLNLLESGYNIVGKTPCVSIETKEECLITGCKPPYPVVKLHCEHTISIMAYKGLVKVQSHESTEAIKCPICRSPCLLHITHHAVSQCIFQKSKQEQSQWEKCQREQNQHRHSCVSKDAFQMLL